MHFPPFFEKRASEFDKHYQVMRIVTCPDKKLMTLKRKSDRVCRFCKLNYGETSFNSEAHLLSKLIGNKYLISDFECDKCNKIFGRYESDLAFYLGPLRAFQGMNQLSIEKSKFKSPNKQVVTETTDFYGADNCVSISREDCLDQTFEFDRETGLTKVKLVKQSYVPLHVFKAILKMALSCLSDKDITNYKLAIDYILSNRLDKHITVVAKILQYTLQPGTGYKSPIAFLFQKKVASQRLITHVFMLYFMNQIYQIAIPLHTNDLRYYDKSDIDCHFCAPLFANENDAATIFLREDMVDLSSSELKKGEEELLSFQYNVEDFKNAVAYDPRTKEVKPSEGKVGEIVRIMFTKADTRIHLPTDKKL